jgi:hypothetical protein
MKYLLTFIRDQDRMFDGTEEERRAEMEAWNEFNRQAAEAGVMIANEALELPETTKTLRITEASEPAITDGPFAETKEQLGGYYLVECDDVDQAVEAASRIPSVVRGSIEVRPIMDFSEVPA